MQCSSLKMLYTKCIFFFKLPTWDCRNNRLKEKTKDKKKKMICLFVFLTFFFYRHQHVKKGNTINTTFLEKKVQTTFIATRLGFLIYLGISKAKGVFCFFLPSESYWGDRT